MKVATDAWTSAGNVVDRPIFRPVGRGDVVGDVGLSEQVVWQLLLRPKACAERVGPQLWISNS